MPSSGTQDSEARPNGTVDRAGTEEPFYVRCGDSFLCVTLHRPHPDLSAGIGLVMCPPWLQEHQFAHPVLVALARFLQERGVAVLRFDYVGSGDSGGDPAAVTESSMIADALTALGVLRRAVRGRVGAMGVRAGAAIARLAASRADDSFLVLVAPVLDVRAYAAELLRAKLSQQTVQTGQVTLTRAMMQERLESGQPLEVYGYPLSAPLYADACARGAVDLAAEPHRPTLVVDITERGRARRAPGVSGEADDDIQGTEAVVSDDHLASCADTTCCCTAVTIRDEAFWKAPRVWRPYRRLLSRRVLDWILSLPRV